MTPERGNINIPFLKYSVCCLLFLTMKDPNMGLKKIAKFLGFSLNEEEIQNVAEKISFKVMKEKSSETHGSFGDTFFRKGTCPGRWVVTSDSSLEKPSPAPHALSVLRCFAFQPWRSPSPEVIAIVK